MRGKRAKQYRKLMHAYQMTFSFHEPYQVLLDAELIQTAQRTKMSLGSMLSNTLHGTIKPMITQCCIRHLYDLPASAEKDACIEVAKQAERRRCGHHELDEPLSTLQCMESVVDPKGSGTNKHRYVVASQDSDVREVMREKIGLPLVYVNRSVMILEPMSRVSEGVREREERGKIRAGTKRGFTEDRAEKRKRDEDDEDEHESTPKKKKKIKGPKGPNPLSVKKSKKEKIPTHSEVVEKAPKQRAENGEGNKARSRDVTDITDGDVIEGARKRKRRRKPKEGEAGPASDVAANAVFED